MVETSKDGKKSFTLRQQLEGKLERAKATRKQDKIEAVEKELAVPPLPRSRAYLMAWFFELCKEREYSSMGNPLSLAGRHFQSWIMTYRRCPTKYELSLLRDLDDVYLTAAKNSRSG